MTQLILFNKPFQVLSQFSPKDDKKTLKDYIPLKNIYPVGRLDYDSEGLMLLTDNGKLQHKLSHPKNKQPKTYWAQVEGIPEDSDLSKLRQDIHIGSVHYQPAEVKRIDSPQEKLWPRNPPIRERKSIPTSWLKLTITEGKNRQVRRMTAHIGFPTLRLIRIQIGNYQLKDLQPGEYIQVFNY